MPTITIRNLDESVKQRLRILAAQHGRSMEAEVREILSRETLPHQKINGDSQFQLSACSAIRGIWKGHASTDEIMAITRGE